MNNQFLRENDSFLDKETEEGGVIAPLSEYVELCKRRNKNLVSAKLVGVSVSKEIIESIWSERKSNLRICRLVKQGEFVVKLINIARDLSVPVGLYKEKDLVAVSSQYCVFKITTPFLLSEYLMMIFRKDRFNREAVYNCFEGVRGALHWKDFVKIKICVPPLKTQEKIVNKYQLLEKMIRLKRKINELLEKWMQAYYHVLFDNLSEDQYINKTFGELFEIIKGSAPPPAPSRIRTALFL